MILLCNKPDSEDVENEMLQKLEDAAFGKKSPEHYIHKYSPIMHLTIEKYNPDWKNDLKS